MRKGVLLICLIILPLAASAKDKHKAKYDTCPFHRIALTASNLFPGSPSCRHWWDSAVVEGSDRVSAADVDGVTIAVWPPRPETCAVLETAFAAKGPITPEARPEWVGEGGNSRWYRFRDNVIRGCIENRRGSFTVIFNDDRMYITGPMLGAIVDEILREGPPETVVRAPATAAPVQPVAAAPPALPSITAYDEGNMCVAQFSAKNYAAAMQTCLQAGKLGDAAAELRMGFLMSGDYGGLKSDYPAMVEWFRKAADHGLSQARLLLGLAYQSGMGIAQDFAAARYWYGLAAGQKNEDAKSRLEALNKEAHSGIASTPVAIQNLPAQQSPRSFKVVCDAKVDPGDDLRCHYGDILNFFAATVQKQERDDTVVAHFPGDKVEQDGKVITFSDKTLFFTARPSDVAPADYVSRWLPIVSAQYQGFKKLWQKELLCDGVPATEVRYIFRGDNGGEYADEVLIAPIRGLAVMAVVRFRVPQPRDNIVEATEVLVASEMVEQTTFADWFRRRALADRGIGSPSPSAAPIVNSAPVITTIQTFAPAPGKRNLHLPMTRLDVLIPPDVSTLTWTVARQEESDLIKATDKKGLPIIFKVQDLKQPNCEAIRQSWQTNRHAKAFGRPLYVPDPPASWWFVDETNRTTYGCVQSAATVYFVALPEGGMFSWGPMLTAVIEAMRDAKLSNGL